MEWVIVWLLFGAITAAIGVGRGRSGCGWLVIGLLLGPIGMLLAWLMNDKQKTVVVVEDTTDRRQCPACAEWIKLEAVRCRFCGVEIQP